MSPKYKLYLFVFLALNLSSCARSKGYFSMQRQGENTAIKPEDPVLLASDAKNPFALDERQVNSPTNLEASHILIDESENTALVRSKVIEKRDVEKQQKFVQREIRATIEKFKTQNKIAEKKASVGHWEPRLKIGVTLLVIGIVLSIFGLGLIGGISAFIGLLFTILGLLNTYY